MRRRDNETVPPNEMTLPGLSGSIPALVGFVCAHARETAFDEERVRHISRAVEEALRNIVNFACRNREGEITIACDVHEMGALLVDIIDSGEPFNMLVASSFPETGDFYGNRPPETSVMKRVMKNIEYRRDAKQNRNILACVIAK